MLGLSFFHHASKIMPIITFLAACSFRTSLLCGEKFMVFCSNHSWETSDEI